MKNKKGQAAMEFLMSYGWAILVVLIATGLLAYFGVLSPDKFIDRINHSNSTTPKEIIIQKNIVSLYAVTNKTFCSCDCELK